MRDDALVRLLADSTDPKPWKLIQPFTLSIQAHLVPRVLRGNAWVATLLRRQPAIQSRGIQHLIAPQSGENSAFPRRTVGTRKKFPDAVQPFIQALPLTQINDALREVMLEGKSLVEVSWRIGILLAYGVVAFLLALKLFRWR
jgi:hypothetical protein